MIPKRIFMIWLGNVVPAYASTSVSLFSKEYSDYDIEFIKYKINDLRKVRDGHIRSDIDGILAECMHEIFDIGDSSAYSAYIKNQLTIYGKSMRNIILLSDMFRLGLLNTFGGIYVDVDSSPVKRFDERLMSNERFCVCRQPYGKTFPDNYFMGQAEGFKTWTNPADANQAVQVMDVTKHDTLFQYRRAAFIKASPVKANGNFYIEHYMVRSWESMGGRTIDDFEP